MDLILCTFSSLWICLLIIIYCKQEGKEEGRKRECLLDVLLRVGRCTNLQVEQVMRIPIQQTHSSTFSPRATLCYVQPQVLGLKSVLGTGFTSSMELETPMTFVPLLHQGACLSETVIRTHRDNSYGRLMITFLLQQQAEHWLRYRE